MLTAIRAEIGVFVCDALGLAYEFLQRRSEEQIEQLVHRLASSWALRILELRGSDRSRLPEAVLVACWFAARRVALSVLTSAPEGQAAQRLADLRFHSEGIVGLALRFGADLEAEPDDAVAALAYDVFDLDLLGDQPHHDQAWSDIFRRTTALQLAVERLAHEGDRLVGEVRWKHLSVEERSRLAGQQLRTDAALKQLIRDMRSRSEFRPPRYRPPIDIDGLFDKLENSRSRLRIVLCDRYALNLSVLFPGERVDEAKANRELERLGLPADSQHRGALHHVHVRPPRGLPIPRWRNQICTARRDGGEAHDLWTRRAVRGAIRDLQGGRNLRLPEDTARTRDAQVLVLMEQLRGQMTDRQLEVFHLHYAGETYRQIGRRLGIAPSTVRTHFERAKAKLKAMGPTAVSAAIGM